MNGSTQYLVAVNITESGVYDLGNTTPNAVFSPLTERGEAGEGGKGGGGEKEAEREKERRNGILSSLQILPPSTRKYKGQGNMSMTPPRFIQQHPSCRKLYDMVSSTNKVKRGKKTTNRLET